MARIIQATPDYSNIYDNLYSTISSTEYFDKNTFDYAVSQGMGNEYLQILTKQNELGNYNDFVKEHNFNSKYADDDYKLGVLFNELVNKNDTSVKEHVRTIYDPYTNEEIEKVYNMTDYEYNKMLYDEIKQYQIEKDKLDVANRIKEERPWFQKAISDVASIATGGLKGVLWAVDGIADSVESLFNIGSDDNFRNTYKNDDWLDNIVNDISEWEMNNVSYIDIETGETTGIGKYVYGVVNSFGMFLPSMALSLIPGAGTAVSMASFSVSMYGNNMSEALNTPGVMSADTWQIVTNSAIKSSFETAITWAMGKLFGPTTLDKMVWGQTSKSAIKGISNVSALKTIGLDALKEGTEEVLQEFSNYFVDNAFEMMNENFAENKNLTLQTLFDSFVIGSLASVAGSAFSVINTNNRKNNKINIEGRNLTKLERWQYNGELSSMFRSAEQALKGKDISKSNDALAQLYINFRNISSVYKELGEERVNAANNFLSSLSTFVTNKTSKGDTLEASYKILDKAGIRRAVGSISRELNTLYENNAKKIVDAKMTEVKQVITKDFLSEMRDLKEQVNEVANNEKLVKNIKSVFDKNKNVTKIVVTVDGATTVTIDDTLFVPYNFLKNANGDVIIKSQAEQQFVDIIVNDENLKPVVNSIFDVYKKLNGEQSNIKEAILSLIYNKSFYRVMLTVSNKQALRFLDSITNLYERVVVKNEKDAMYKKTLSDAKKNLSVELMLYLTNQQEESGYWEYKSLNNNQKQWIQNHRFSRNLYNKIINQKLYNTLTLEEKQTMQKRIDALPISSEEKMQLYKDFQSSSQASRSAAMAIIDRHYRNVFTSPYDNITYLAGTGLPQVTFNSFLQTYNLDLNKLLLPVTDPEVIQKIQKTFGSLSAKNTIKYYQMLFSEFTNKAYLFSIENGMPVIREDKPIVIKGYTNYYANRDNIITGSNIEQRSFTTVNATRPSIFTSMLNKELSPVFKQSVSIADVIRNPNYLSKTTQSNIKNKYGTVNPLNTFLYLREYMLQQTGTTSIVVTSNGDFIFANVTPMIEVLKNKSVTFNDIKDGDNVSKFVKDEYLTADLKNTKVRISKNGETYYNPSTNSIYIDSSTFENKGPYFRFALLHEFQHAVQYNNRLNLGINERWLVNSSMSKTKKQELVKDIRKHVPDLFTDVKVGSDREFDLAQQYIYDTSAESQANGMDYVSGVIDFYPTIVDTFKGKTTITTPWGTKYELGGTNSVSLNINNVMYNDFVEVRDRVDKEFVDANMDNFYKGFITPEGKIKSNQNVIGTQNSHHNAYDLIYSLTDNKAAATSYLSDCIDITSDIALGEGKSAGFLHVDKNPNQYTIRTKTPNINEQQEKAIFNFILEQSKRGKMVVLSDPFSDARVVVELPENIYTSIQKMANESGINADELYASYIKDYLNDVRKTWNNRYARRTIHGRRDIVDTTGFNIYNGNEYYEARKTIKEFFPDTKYGKNVQSAIVEQNGQVRYGGDIRFVNFLINSDNDFTKSYYSSTVQIDISDSINVHLPVLTNIAQVNSLFDTLKSITNGEEIIITLPRVENDSIVEEYKISSNSYNTFESFANDVRTDIEYLRRQVNYSRKLSMMPKYFSNDMSFPRQPDSKYVNRKDSENTNLKYAKKQYNYKNMDARLQALYKESTGNEALMNQDLVKKIRKGTLTLKDVYSYFNSNELTEFDFDLINRTVFKNDKITSLQQLNDLVALQSDYYAIAKVMRSLGLEQLLNDTNVDNEIISQIREVISKDEASASLYAKYSQMFDTYGRKDISIDNGNTKVRFMTTYNGSINSAYAVANSTRNYSAFKSLKNTSMDADIEGKKGDDSSYTLGERIEAKQNIVEEINTNLTDEEKAIWMADYYTNERRNALLDKYQTTLIQNEEKVREKAKEYEERTGKKLSEEQIIEKVKAVNKKTEDAFEKSIEKYREQQEEYWLNKAKYSDDFSGEDSFDAQYFRAVSEANESLVAELASREELEYENYVYSSERPKSAIVNNIKNAILPMIKRHIDSMSKAARTKAMQEIRENYSDIITEKFKLKQGVTDKSFDELLEIENRLSSLRTKAKMDAWKNKTNRQAYYKWQKYQDEVRQLRQENRTLKIAADLNTGVKRQIERGISRTTEYQFNDAKITIISSFEMPNSLRKIANKSFTGFLTRTNVQEVSETDSRHYRISMKYFFEENASVLSTLSTEQVEEIANFFMSSEAIISNVSEMSETDIRKYNSLRNYILGYIMYNYKNGNSYNISSDLYNQISKFYELKISTSAADLRIHQDVIKLLKPQELMIASLAKSSGIDLEGHQAELDQLTAAIKSGDPELLRQAMKPIKDIAFEQNKLKLSNKTIWDQLWRFQRVCMLSSPGTWIRNITSNITVKAGNEVGSIIGQKVYDIIAKFLPKKAKASIENATNQYKIVGTKVPSEYATFIKEQILDNNLLDIVNDGLDKYDTAKIGNTSSQDTLTDIVANAIISNVVQSQQFKLKGLNSFAKFVFKMISDDKYIRKSVIKYLGKILVENNVDISKGISNEVIQCIADAYGLASYDYMHRYNAFNKLEKIIKDNVGDAAFFVYKQILPFASASWNWFVEGLQYTPLGIANGIIKLAKFENTVAKMEKSYNSGDSRVSNRFAKYLAIRSIGKGIIGSITMGIGILLGATGLVDLEDDDTGTKLKVGDLTIDISNLFGIQGVFLGIALTNPTKGDWQKMLIGVLDTMFLDSTFGDMYNNFRYSDTIGEYMVAQLGNALTSFMPNAIRFVSQVTNNSKIKYSSGILGSFERFFNTIPFADRLLPTYKDPYTGETQAKYNIPWIWYIANKLSPVKIEKYNVSEVEKEAVSVGVEKASLTGRYEDIGNLSPSELEILNTKYGQLNNKTLTELQKNRQKYKVQNEDGTYDDLYYYQMTTEQKKSVTERIMSHNATIAKIYYYTSQGGKYYANESTYKELKELGIVKGVYKETDKLKGFV